MPGGDGLLADLQRATALRDAAPSNTKFPGPFGQIRPTVWSNVRSLFPSLYSEQGECFVICVKMCGVHVSFLSTFVLSHHPQRGGTWNSFGGSQLLVREDKGCYSNSQQNYTGFK